jgi:hypothetical protein
MAGRQFRAQQRRKIRLDQKMGHQAIARRRLQGANADIEIAMNEIDQRRAAIEPHSDIGMSQLKQSQIGRQPLHGKSGHGGDGKLAVQRPARIGEGTADQVESLLNIGRQPGAGFGQFYTPGLAHE